LHPYFTLLFQRVYLRGEHIALRRVVWCAQHELTRPPPVPVAPSPKDTAASASNPFSRMFQSMFGSSGGKEPNSPSASAGGHSEGGYSAAAAAAAAPAAATAAGSLGVMRDSLDGSQKAGLTVRDAPGAGLVLWAESAAGSMELERPYTHSTSLDGELGAAAISGWS